MCPFSSSADSAEGYRHRVRVRALYIAEFTAVTPRKRTHHDRAIYLGFAANNLRHVIVPRARPEKAATNQFKLDAPCSLRDNRLFCRLDTSQRSMRARLLTRVLT